MGWRGPDERLIVELAHAAFCERGVRGAAGLRESADVGATWSVV